MQAAQDTIKYILICAGYLGHGTTHRHKEIIIEMAQAGLFHKTGRIKACGISWQETKASDLKRMIF